MGLRDFFRSKFSSAYEKRIEAAADQLWQALMLKRTIEIPAIHSTEDDVMNAILRLREKYPLVGVTMLQSKSIVLTREVNASKEAMDVLGKANYFPDAALPGPMLFAMHEEFQKYNARIDPKVAEMEALEAQRKQDAIVIGKVGTAPAAPAGAPAVHVSAPPAVAEPVAEPAK